MNGVLEQLPAHLASKIKIDPSGCWLWMAASSQGYGHVRLGSRVLRAHRLVYTTLRGDPGGKLLDHLCRVRQCVNPDHLEPVTNRENCLRGVGVGAVNAVKTHCLHGHPFDEVNTYYRVDRLGRNCRACRREQYQRAKSEASQ